MPGSETWLWVCLDCGTTLEYRRFRCPPCRRDAAEAAKVAARPWKEALRAQVEALQAPRLKSEERE